MKEEILCPVKNKKVYITKEYIGAGALEDKGRGALVPGRYVCTDNDWQCYHDKCPIDKNEIEARRIID